MNQRAYINQASRFLPNMPVSNDEMESYLGKISGVKSKAKNLILRSNGIKTRYYAIDKNHNHTHTNAELAYEAIKKLDINLNQVELLSLGTTSPDQLLPSHASMVHGLLANRPMDVISPQGSCNSGMLAFKYAYMAVASGSVSSAIAGGSEKLSSWLVSERFEDESEKLQSLENTPYIAFEREFLRWMLSDGAAVTYLSSKPNSERLSLEVNWIDIQSYAHEIDTCMYAGAVKQADGSLIPWRNFDNADLMRNSILSLNQDSRMLGRNIVEYGSKALKEVCKKYNFKSEDIHYFLPHISSEFFRNKIEQLSKEAGCYMPQDKWFTNLTKFGNIGSASAFLMIEELLNEGKLVKGQKVLVMSPESARFSYAFMMLTVV